MFSQSVHPLYSDIDKNAFVIGKIWGKADIAKGIFALNKAFVGLGSCENVQIEMSIFEYAKWPRLQIKRTSPSSWSA